MTQMYLKGELYKDSEIAKQMLPLQIDNIERVLNNENYWFNYKTDIKNMFRTH
jgi:hypothetical protein